MEADPAYAHFLLDGQLAVVDDYLAVRPEADRAAAAAHRQRAHRRRAPGTRSRTSSWSAARRWCATCSWPAHRRPLRWRDAGGVPARHVRPRGPDAPDPGRVRVRARRGVARRAGGDRPQRLLVAGARRHHGPGRVHAPGLRQRVCPARRRQGVRAGGRRLRRPVGRPAHRARPVDERHRPPDATALAGPGGGRGQRHPGRPRPAHHVAGRAPGRRAHRRPAHLAGRAALRVPGPTC